MLAIRHCNNNNNHCKSRGINIIKRQQQQQLTEAENSTKSTRVLAQQSEGHRREIGV